MTGAVGDRLPIEPAHGDVRAWVIGALKHYHATQVEDYVNEFKPAPVKPTASIADLDKLDVRVGSIVAVEDVPKSVKLLRLTVDFGDHQRTILAGMKTERATPQELVGRQALFVVNLEPKRMADQVSEGMLFDIGYADGVLPALAVPERPVPNGVRAG